MIGQTISHYTILEKLGEGGMGVVYKAHDTKLDRTVALKFLPHHFAADEKATARLLQEAKAAAALNHPNICTIYAIEEADDTQFIVMEYVDGQTLHQAIALGADGYPLLPMNDAISFAIQIGGALHEAHSKGIVHRDVKSENIMVNSKNQIKVMDFGLAKLKGSLKITKTMSTLGTLAYMAPEQIRAEEVDARSDIFSFGVVVFEMLTGQLPFRGEHAAAMMYSILQEEPRSVTSVRADVPKEFERIINKSLAKVAAERYQHMDKLIADITLAQPGSPSKGTEQSRDGRRLSAIMFTDMVGYSALTQRNELRAIELLEEHRGLLRPLFPKYGGREIETVGDAFFVEFGSAVEAVRCAVEIQHVLHERNQAHPTEERIRIRIGIHLGDVIQKGNHVLGDGVNIAARLEPLAPPEGICISEDVARQVQNKLDIPLQKLGQHNLNNIQFPMVIYSVQLPWGPQPAEGTAVSPKQERVIETGATLSKKILSTPLFAAAVGTLVLVVVVYFLTLKKDLTKLEISQPQQSSDTVSSKPTEIKEEKKPIAAPTKEPQKTLAHREESSTEVSKKDVIEVEKKAVPPVETIYYNPDSVLAAAREQFKKGALSDARTTFNEALQQYRATRGKKGEADALLGIAKVLKYHDELPIAEGKAQEALAAYNSTGDNEGIAKARVLTADILIEEGKAKDAENILGQVVSSPVSKATGDAARALMAKAHMALDNMEDALKQARYFDEGWQRTGDAETDVLVMSTKARITGTVGETGTGRQRMRQRMDIPEYISDDAASLLEGRLAVNELGLKHKNSSQQHRSKLQALEREARAKGFALIARKARAVLQ
jgi:class 3 adenylate cyclase/tetratricopeptide (TPR) repeat protein/predicted Ser/Thr protein kinase